MSGKTWDVGVLGSRVRTGSGRWVVWASLVKLDGDVVGGLDQVKDG